MSFSWATLGKGLTSAFNPAAGDALEKADLMREIDKRAAERETLSDLRKKRTDEEADLRRAQIDKEKEIFRTDEALRLDERQKAAARSAKLESMAKSLIGAPSPVGDFSAGNIDTSADSFYNSGTPLELAGSTRLGDKNIVRQRMIEPGEAYQLADTELNEQERQQGFTEPMAASRMSTVKSRVGEETGKGMLPYARSLASAASQTGMQEQLLGRTRAEQARAGLEATADTVGQRAIEQRNAEIRESQAEAARNLNAYEEDVGAHPVARAAGAEKAELAASDRKLNKIKSLQAVEGLLSTADTVAQAAKDKRAAEMEDARKSIEESRQSAETARGTTPKAREVAEKKAQVELQKAEDAAAPERREAARGADIAELKEKKAVADTIATKPEYGMPGWGAAELRHKTALELQRMKTGGRGGDPFGGATTPQLGYTPQQILDWTKEGNQIPPSLRAPTPAKR